MAVNVGKPKVIVHRDTVVDRVEPPHMIEVLSVEGQAKPGDKCLETWLEAEVRSVSRQWVHDDTVTVKQQKRLSVGFFPGMGEVILKPRGALDPIWNRPQAESRMYHKEDHGNYEATTASGYHCVLEYAALDAGCLLGLLGVPSAIATLETLLVEPFRGWTCDHDFYDKSRTEVFSSWNSVYMLDASVSPKLRLLLRFTPEERARMDFKTCFDWPRRGKPSMTDMFAHFGLVGVHKHMAVFVEEGKEPERSVEAETRRTETVRGPYVATLRIPEAEIERTVSVGEGESKAVFELPRADRGGPHEATVEFRSRYAGTDAVGRAWDVRTLRQTVWLQEKPKPKSPLVVSAEPQDIQVIHHYHETRVVEERKHEGQPWSIETTEPFRDGRAEYLVTILDGSKSPFEVEREVKPELEGNLRKSFAASMPGLDERLVRAYAVAEYGKLAIRFKGVAFSAQPLTDGWSYDARARRGVVRLRISEGMAPEEAKLWARENIGAIVQEKNVALEAGEAPPPGAKYLSLSEVLENGVLTVEFEAVE